MVGLYRALINWGPHASACPLVSLSRRTAALHQTCSRHACQGSYTRSAHCRASATVEQVSADHYVRLACHAAGLGLWLFGAKDCRHAWKQGADVSGVTCKQLVTCMVHKTQLDLSGAVSDSKAGMVGTLFVLLSDSSPNSLAGGCSCTGR